MSTAIPALVSEAEFLTLPESSTPMELVDGEVVVAPSPSYWHQEVLARLVGRLRAWAATEKGPVTVVQAPLDVRFDAGRILQPDAMIFLVDLPREAPSPLDRIPDLCIEVLSGNRTYDRVTKRFIYAAAGVKEYWIVDPAGLVERCSGPDLARREEIDERLTTDLLPGFELRVRDLFD